MQERISRYIRRLVDNGTGRVLLQGDLSPFGRLSNGHIPRIRRGLSFFLAQGASYLFEFRFASPCVRSLGLRGEQIRENVDDIVQFLVGKRGGSILSFRVFGGQKELLLLLFLLLYIGT